MKKLLFSALMLLISVAMFAQSDAYTSGMKKMIERLNSLEMNPENYQEAANGFIRIADAEKTEWLPSYYAAYCLVMQAMLTEDKSTIDPILDQADELLSKVSTTTKSDEIMCIQAFSKSSRIGVDPMTRGMKYSMESAKFLGQAQALNPENPRVYFLQAQSAFYTPEQFGGGKKAALKLFETALAKYESFKPLNDLMPLWGKAATIKMIEECKK